MVRAGSGAVRTNNRYVLIGGLLHVSHVPNGYIFIVKSKSDNICGTALIEPDV